MQTDMEGYDQYHGEAAQCVKPFEAHLLDRHLFHLDILYMQFCGKVTK